MQMLWSDCCDPAAAAAAEAEHNSGGRGRRGGGKSGGSGSKTRKGRNRGALSPRGEEDCFTRLRRHAELVLQLRGTDATEDMFNLVFKPTSVTAATSSTSALALSTLASGASSRLRLIGAMAKAPVPGLARLFSLGKNEREARKSEVGGRD